jgi:hypothetical protein
MSTSKLTVAMTACAAVVIAAAAGIARAQQANAPAAGVQITRAGAQASATGPAEWFTGRVRVDPLFAADSSINASGVGDL